MIIDSHCHLNYEPMSLDLKKTIDRAQKDGVKYLLTISTEDKRFNEILKIVKDFDCVYGTYGIHPKAKNHLAINSKKIVTNIKANNKIIGVGECGLDFLQPFTKNQIKCFEEHIIAAQETQFL